MQQPQLETVHTVATKLLLDIMRGELIPLPYGKCFLLNEPSTTFTPAKRSSRARAPDLKHCIWPVLICGDALPKPAVGLSPHGLINITLVRYRQTSVRLASRTGRDGEIFAARRRHDIYR
jgi:hypothetical protein